jgi:hypothetical protein
MYGVFVDGWLLDDGGLIDGLMDLMHVRLIVPNSLSSGHLILALLLTEKIIKFQVLLCKPYNC